MSENQALQTEVRDDGDGADAVVALARLISAAALYPPTHPRIVDIASPVLDAVRSAAADAPFVVSTSVDDADERGASLGTAARLLRDLDALGIARIEISRGASIGDLVAFAHFLRGQSDRGTGTEFRHADLSALPTTIRVCERQFDETSFRADDDATETVEVERDVDARSGAGTSAATEQEILALIRLAMTRNGGELAVDESSTNPANRREQMRAVAETVRTWIDRQTKGSLGTRTAAEILEEAERELPQMLPGVQWNEVLHGIGRSIDAHMRDRFRTEARADFDVASTKSTESERAETSEEDLARAVSEFTAGAAPLDLGTTVDGGEHLTILLHMLGAAGSRAANEGIETRLSACLATPRGPLERDVLVRWLRDVCRDAAAADLDRRLSAVTGALRAERRGAVAELLLDACAAPHRDAAGPLWPHLAYELVTYDESCGEGRMEEIESLVVGVPRTRIQEEAARLVAIVTRGAEAVATSAFLPPRPPLYPIYEILIDTPRRAGFTVVVTTAFKRHPPPHAAAGALVALAPTDERARRLVARLLRERDAPSPALRTLAVEILVDTLRRLPEPRRDEVWVESAIRALGRLPSPASAEMIREVLGGRRFLFNCTWPEFARRAAADAMAGAAA